MKVNFIGVAGTPGHREDGGHILVTSAHERGHCLSVGKGRGAPDPRARGPWSTGETWKRSCSRQKTGGRRTFLSAAPNVEFEKHELPRAGEKYSRFMVPGGGLVFPATTEPFVRGLRCLHLERQTEGALRHGGDPGR